MSSTRSVFIQAACVLLVAALAMAAHAATYIVQPDGLGDYPTIQEAVSVCADGDTVTLTNGTFTGEQNRDIVVPSISVTIHSQSENYLNCIIDCEGSARDEHRGFLFTTDVGTGDALLRNVAVVNGYVTNGGGGIWIEGASPEIRNCAVASCVVDGATRSGGGIYVTDGATPLVIGCNITGNEADYGGGIAIWNSGGTYYSTEMRDNVAGDVGGGMYVQGSGLCQISYCDIVSNDAARGGGVRLLGGNTQIANSIIARNDATSHGGGVWMQGGVLTSSTLVDNSAPNGGGVYCRAGSGNITKCIIAFSSDGHGVGAYEAGDVPYLQCCDVYGNDDGDYDSVVGDQTGINNNFSDDPELCGLGTEDYWLYDTSPCLATSSPCGERVGRYDIGCDSPVESTSWGRLKALWR